MAHKQLYHETIVFIGHYEWSKPDPNPGRN